MDEVTAVSSDSNGQEEEDLDKLLALDESLSGDGLLSNRYNNASTLSDDMQQLFLQSPTTSIHESTSQTVSVTAAASTISSISTPKETDTPGAKIMFLSPQQQQRPQQQLSSPPLSSSSPYGMTAVTGQSSISPTTFLDSLLLDSNAPPTRDDDSKEQVNIFLAPPPLFTIDDDDDERLDTGMDDLECLFSKSTEVVDVVVPSLHNINVKNENLPMEYATPDSDKAVEKVEAARDSSGTTDIPSINSAVRVAFVQETRESLATATASSPTIATTNESPKKFIVPVELDYTTNKNEDSLTSTEKQAPMTPEPSSLVSMQGSLVNDNSETLPLFSSQHSPAGDEELQEQQQENALDLETSNVPIVSPSHHKSLMVMKEDGFSSFGDSLQESIIASDWNSTDEANGKSQQGGGGGADSSMGSVDDFPETASSEDFHSFVTAREDDGDNSTLASKEQCLAASQGDDDDNAHAISFSDAPLLEQSFSADRQPGDWSIEEDDPTTPKRSGREFLLMVENRVKDTDAINTAAAAAPNESKVGPGTQPTASTKNISAVPSSPPSLESAKPTLLVPLLEQHSESTSMGQEVMDKFPLLKATYKESELKFISLPVEDPSPLASSVLVSAVETIGVAAGPQEIVEKEVQQKDYGGCPAECPSDEVSWKSSSQATGSAESLRFSRFGGLATKLSPADTLLDTSRHEEEVVGDVNNVEIVATIPGLDEREVRNESQTNNGVDLAHSTMVADAMVQAPAVVHTIEPVLETHADEAEEAGAGASWVSSALPPPVAEESPVAISPLSSQQFKESQRVNDVVRPMRKQPKSLQVEFPTVLDRSLNKSDVSLSSASSTISHGSFTRGLAMSGMTSPYNAEEMLRRACSEAVHPRSPTKGNEMNESPKSFADSLSKRLAVRENLTDDSDNVETKWIKQSIPLSFNPKKSIFASNLDTAKCPDISPPGSPPEPIYSDFDDDGDSFNDESRGNSSGSPELNPEAGTWDMMLDDADDRNRPDFVVLPEPGRSFISPPIESADDLCTESSLAPSEVDIDRDKPFKHSTNQMKSSLNTSSSFTTAIKHRGMIRALSFVSRGSGRHSVSSGKSRGRGRSSKDPKITAIPIVRYGEARTMPSRRVDSETVSLGGRSSSPPPRLPIGNMFHGTHQSSPDLQRLAEQRGAIKPVSPVKLLVCDGVTQTPQIVGEEPLISDALYSDMISPETLNGRFATLNDSDSVEPEHKSALLEEELLAFSSFRRIDLPFRYTNPLASFDYIGSVLWRQLVACWKHSEMTRAMMTRAPSPHFSGTSDRGDGDETSFGDSSCHRRGTSVGDLELHGVLLKANQVRAGTNNFDGFIPLQRELRLSTITRFLSKVGGSPSGSSGQNLCQELLSDNNITVQSLLSEAESNAPVLTSVVEDIVAFASMKYTAKGELNDGATRFAVGVKDRQAIERKAERKYCGDTFHVKDILRAQITFAEEGELVCGLVRLFQITGLLEGGGNGSCSEIKLVRIKNLFCSESLLVNLPTSPLPTGYRHLLINIRLKNGLLAEIQFNLSSLFDVLGHEGHLLHRELMELKHAFDMREKYTKAIPSFDINDLISEAYGLSPPKKSLFEAFSSIPIANCGAARYAASLKEGGTMPSSRTPQGYDGGVTPQTKNVRTEQFTKDVTMSASMGDQVDAADPSASFTAPTPANSLRNMDTPTMGQHSASGKSRGGGVFEETARGMRRGLLDEISAHRGVLSGGDLFLSVLQHGSSVAAHNPRDVATFYCLYALFSYIVKRENGGMLSSLGFGVQNASDVSEFAQQCLLRCLKISNQAISTGMNGWLEYGCSSALDRLTERPFVVLRHIAYDLGRRDKWGDAECVLLALVVRCEQYLPLYHPTTLTALLDLALASSMVGKTTFAERIVSRAADRLSTYLTEMEHNYLSHLSQCSSVGKHGDTVFRIEHGRDAIFMLHAFVSLFQSYLSRGIVTLVGNDNDIILTNHCFLADALSVLANCSAASRCLLGSASDSSRNDGAQYWQLAFAHYQRAFNGFARSKGLDDPSVARAAFGLARCLREFGESEKALQLLSLVVSYTEKTAAAGNPIEETKINDEEPKQGLSKTPRFLPRSLSSKTSSDKIRASKHTSSAHCLWLMAILSLDQAPNEEGRERAFSYLHAASVSLQSVLNILNDVDDGPTRATCIQFLAAIEDEALQISEPIYE